WEAELDGEVVTGTGWDHLATRGFDAPHLFSAYLHTLRWNCVTATNPRLFQSPFRAGIRIDAYQIEPLRKALLLPRVNLFIADDVGLGKTIEAGLIARELLLRKKVRDIVVACPPSVLPQWQDELEQRFGLGFEVLDKDYVIRVRRERGYGTNPWATHAPFLISHPLLIDGAFARPRARLAGPFPRRFAADPRRGSPRRPGERLALRHRLEDHPCHPRPGPALRAPAVPVGHAAQRPLQQLLRPAGDPRPATLLPRRAGQGKEAARRRHGAPAQGRHPLHRRGPPPARRPADRPSRPARRRPRAAAAGPAR